jgi:S-adenosylmethionine hydrolase
LKPSGIITLTTDFGESDPYVAMMKGVILSINPDATIIDITHQIPARSIREGGLSIKASYTYFPSGTIHVGVIDPGVGGKRKPIVVLTHNHYFVGPDNGLFSTVIKSHAPADIIHLTEKGYWMNHISPTFHGRDIFAPVAAHLSLGVNPFHMGEPIDHATLLAHDTPQTVNDNLIGEIVRVDHFGNCITNITREHLSPWLASGNFMITVGKLTLRKISTTYEDVPKGRPVALIGSSNLLEIAVHRGRAVDRAGGDKAIGTKVEVKPL